MESANVAPTSTSSTAKVDMPKIESDGEIDLSDHQLDAELEKEGKAMEASMAQRVQAGDAPKKQLAAVATKVQSGEATMTRQMRAQRWLNSHGMEKMGNILAGHASKADAAKAVEAKSSTQDLVVDMDDDDTVSKKWGKVDKLRQPSF